jgi:predicted oxidoreductase
MAGFELDGNAIAGDLREIFAVDLTAAVATCAGCGRPSVVATLRVWGPAAGVVARCPSCGEVVLRLVRGPEQVWLDLRGATRLEIALPPVESVAEGPA